MATLKQRLHRKNGSNYDTIHLETDASVIHMSTSDTTTLTSKLTTMQTSIDGKAASSHNHSAANITSGTLAVARGGTGQTSVDSTPTSGSKKMCTSGGIYTAINDLKTSVSNGKSAVASAITDKGVSTSATASFDTMAANIAKIKVNDLPVAGTDFTYTGDYTVDYNDKNDYWTLKFLTSGTFKPLKAMSVDVFLVGGGAGGATVSIANEAPGGGSGYTSTNKKVSLTANTEYAIVIGEGGAAANNGGTSSAFSKSVNGGNKGSGSANSAKGGNGGSGGGGRTSGEGGVDGADGGGTSGYGGTGQGTTTREFAETNGRLYSTGGGSSKSTTSGQAGSKNTGDGGSGGTVGGKGGSGIVVIRTAQ